MQIDIKYFVEFCDTNNRTPINFRDNFIIFFKYLIPSFSFLLPPFTVLLTIRGIWSKVYTAWVVKKG